MTLFIALLVIPMTIGISFFLLVIPHLLRNLLDTEDTETSSA